ncbi:MAG TPA: right-handed parallel beta-helix repeat-containing protein [Anaerolineae bacterium]
MQTGLFIRRVAPGMVAIIIAATLLSHFPHDARAAGVVGTGSPASCTEAALRSALVGGGLVTFNCGSAPHTIALANGLNITQTTTIDGGGLISLSGGNSTPIMAVGFITYATALTLKNITLADGHTTFLGGGAILNSSNATLLIENSRILNNSAIDADGGGILNVGVLTVTNSTIAGNTAQSIGGGGGDGGGLYNAGGTATIIASTLSGNRAISATNYSNGFGGGVANQATLTLINSTISGNDAYGSGGGILNAGTLSLYNATVTNNQADADFSCAGPDGGTGGGLYNLGGTFTFRNTILAGNYDTLKSFFCFSHVNDCASSGTGTLTNGGYNLMQNYTGSGLHACTFINGAPSLADPKLGGLANNGGPTLTHALAYGSPAIDGGDPSGCVGPGSSPLLTDQRGQPRPAGGAPTRCDIGAYELLRLWLPIIQTQ